MGNTEELMNLARKVDKILKEELTLASIEHDLAEATEKVVEAELEKKIAETAQKAESVRRAVRRPTRPTSGPSGNVNQ